MIPKKKAMSILAKHNQPLWFIWRASDIADGLAILEYEPAAWARAPGLRGETTVKLGGAYHVVWHSSPKAPEPGVFRQIPADSDFLFFSKKDAMSQAYSMTVASLVIRKKMLDKMREANRKLLKMMAAAGEAE